MLSLLENFKFCHSFQMWIKSLKPVFFAIFKKLLPIQYVPNKAALFKWDHSTKVAPSRRIYQVGNKNGQTKLLLSCIVISILTVFRGGSGDPNRVQIGNWLCLLNRLSYRPLSYIFGNGRWSPKSCGDMSPVYHPFRRAWMYGTFNRVI